MPEYTRRPLQVTAYQFDGSSLMATRLHQWHISCKGASTPMFTTREALEKAIADPNHKASMSYDPHLGLCRITSLNGDIELMTGDWLVHTPSHDFLKMSNEDFTEEHVPILKPVGVDR